MKNKSKEVYMDLSQNVQFIKGVGEARAKVLNRLRNI